MVKFCTTESYESHSQSSLAYEAAEFYLRRKKNKTLRDKAGHPGSEGLHFQRLPGQPIYLR